jgi:conjugal transfer ATP-binding protein TraC
MGLFGKKPQPTDPVSTAQQQQALEQAEVEAAFREGIVSMRDFIAPSSMEFQNNYFRIGSRYGRCFYIYGYPRQLFTGWMSSLINIDEVIDISMYIYPADSGVVLKSLRRKVAQLEATRQISAEKGRVRDPGTEAALEDAENLRDKLQVGEERFFRFGLYFSIYGETMDDLEFVQHKVESLLGQQLIYSKVATTQQEQCMNSVIPQGIDELQIRRNLSTGALSTTFPFTSADLSQDDGILYGINQHNNGLVIFDRFSLENANAVVFAKSGAGKSFTVKLEALRHMMMGTEVIIIDPENEYQRLAEAVGGSYVRLSLNSQSRINPFDLPRIFDEEEGDNALRSNIITMHGLMRLMFGGRLDPAAESDLDQAMIETYAQVGITNDPLTHNTTPPTIVDLYQTLLHSAGSGPQMAQMLRKFTSGTFAGLFSQQSNVSLDNKMVVFNIRDLEEELRPMAMYIVLSYIWNRVRADQKKRMLIVDEAWQLLQYEDSAKFMFSLAKRARKYYLGLTTISQDVEDMLSSKMGRAIVSNSSLQILLKQSPSAADVVAGVFKLTSEERNRLTQFPVGQGLFFAGLNHVHLKIDASPTETELITTSPQQIAAIKASAKAEEGVTTAELFSQYNQELKELEKEKEDAIKSFVEAYASEPEGEAQEEPEQPSTPVPPTPVPAQEQTQENAAVADSMADLTPSPVVENPGVAALDQTTPPVATPAEPVKAPAQDELQETEIRIEH